MTGRTHTITALVTSILLSDVIQEPKDKVFFIIGSCITSRLPDIDLKLKMKHRGYTHSMWAVFILSIVIAQTSVKPITIGFIWGYMVHILADAFTVSGIYPFYPSTWNMRLGRIKTGNRMQEQCFILVLTLIVGGYYYLKLKGV